MPFKVFASSPMFSGYALAPLRLFAPQGRARWFCIAAGLARKSRSQNNAGDTPDPVARRACCPAAGGQFLASVVGEIHAGFHCQPFHQVAAVQRQRPRFTRSPASGGGGAEAASPPMVLPSPPFPLIRPLNTEHFQNGPPWGPPALFFPERNSPEFHAIHCKSGFFAEMLAFVFFAFQMQYPLQFASNLA